MPSKQARRRAAAALLVVAAVAAVAAAALHAAAHWGAESVMARAESFGLQVRRDAAPPVPREPESRQALVARLATLAPAPGVPDLPTDIAATEGLAPADPPRDVAASFAVVADPMVRRRLNRWLHDLAVAVHDEDAPPREMALAWLQSHDAELEAIEVLLLAEPDSQRILDAMPAPEPADLSPAVRLSRSAWGTRAALGARAALAAVQGRQDDAERTLAALLRMEAVVHVAGHAGYPSVPSAVLRRVRPRDATDWIALIDTASNASREQLLAGATALCVWPAPRERMSFGIPELDALREDLPGPIEAALQRGLIVPAGRVQWALRTRGILEDRDRAAADDECLTDDVPLREQDEGSWETEWRRVLALRADALLTREVLRLAHPHPGIEPAPSPCADWSVIAERREDGSLRVAVSASRRAALAAAGVGRPLERVIPPGP